MTITDAARELGVNPSTLRYRLRRGHMTGEKIGPRAWLIPMTEVERWKQLGRMKRGPRTRANDAAGAES